jgi:O-antigen/teichoic acid export membrane protein
LALIVVSSGIFPNPVGRFLADPALGGREASLIMDQSTFRRALLSTLGLDVVGRALNAVTAILLLRALSVSDFAFIVLFLAVGLFLGNAAAGGVRLRYVREEAERVSRGLDEPGSFAAALAGGTLVICGITALGFVGGVLAGVGRETPDLAVFVVLVTGFAVAEAATELVSNHHQAHLEFVKGGLVGVVRGFVLLPTGLAAAVGVLGSGVAAATTMTIALLAFGTVVAWPLARSRGSRKIVESRFGLGSESGWLTVVHLAGSGLAYIDVFVIAAILSPIEVATFGAAQRYYNLVLGAVPPMLAVLRVRTSQRDIVDSERAQREMLLSWAKRAVLPAAALLAAAAALAPYLVPLLDRGRYPLSIPVFQLMLVGAFATYLALPGDNLLMSQRHFRTLAVTLVVALVGKAAVDLVAGSLLGIVGVAVATTAVTVATAIALCYLALRRDVVQRGAYETASTKSALRHSRNSRHGRSS